MSGRGGTVPRLDAFPFRSRQRHRTRLAAVRRIAVKVRAAGDEQIQPTRHFDVLLDEGSVVIRMKRLDSIETGSRERRNSRSQAVLSGVGERGDPSRLVDDVDDGFRRGTLARNEPRAAALQPYVKRFVRARDVARRDHRVRHLRPSDRSAALTPGLFDHRSDIDRYAVRGKTRTNGLDARNPGGALRSKERGQAVMLRVEQIA